MTALGIFGKLPAHGDFVARGLDRRSRDELDAWLSQSLEQARLTDPDRFTERYDSAPPWFMRCVTQDIAQEAVLLPSIDAVGRRFPLYVEHPAIREMAPGRLAAALADLAREAILGGWDVDRLAAASVAADAGEWYADPPDAPGAAWWTPETERNAAMGRDGHRPPDLITAMLLVGDAIQ